MKKIGKFIILSEKEYLRMIYKINKITFELYKLRSDNMPDIDFPNSEKGGKANQDRPDNCPDFSDF